MSNEANAKRYAAAAFHQELASCRALRYPPITCYDRACDVLVETYNLALDPGREAPLTRFRMIQT